MGVRGHFLSADPPKALCVSTAAATDAFGDELIRFTVAEQSGVVVPLF